MSSFLRKETSCGSILVRDHLPLATTKSAHFGWSLSEGSTAVSFSSSSAASIGTCFGSWVSRIDLHTKALLHYILKSTSIILYLKENAPWQVVQLRDDLRARGGEGEGGTLAISGWGCPAGTLKPLTYTKASLAEFGYLILE